MTADQLLPAPGSTVPGAPPPLRRPTTADDGVLLRPNKQHQRATTTADQQDVTASTAPPPRTNGYLVALGLLAAAVAIELDTRLHLPRTSPRARRIP